MRHLGSLIAGLVVAPLAWVLIAAGQPRTAQTFERWRGLETVYTGDVLRPIGLVAGAGLLLGLVLALRLSPLGPLVAGLAYLGTYGYAFRDPFRVLDLLPQLNLRGYRIDTTVPFTNGTMALIGAALVVAALSRRRWQGWPARTAGAPETPEAPVSPGLGPVSPGSGAVSPGSGAVSPATGVGEPEGPPAAVGPMPPFAGGTPLSPSTFGESGTRTPTASELTMSPGTAEDLPRRTPPKRPAPPVSPAPPAFPEPDPGAWPEPSGWPEPRTVGWPGSGPVIPGPRHAAAEDGPIVDGPIQPMFRMPPGGPSPAPDEVPPPRSAYEDRPTAGDGHGPSAGPTGSAGRTDAARASGNGAASASGPSNGAAGAPGAPDGASGTGNSGPNSGQPAGAPPRAAPTRPAPTEEAPPRAAPTRPAPTEEAPPRAAPTRPAATEAAPPRPAAQAAPGQAAPSQAAPSQAPSHPAPSQAAPQQPPPPQAAPPSQAPPPPPVPSQPAPPAPQQAAPPAEADRPPAVPPAQAEGQDPPASPWAGRPRPAQD